MMEIRIMSEKYADLQMLIYTVDGTRQTIVEKDPEDVERTLADLNPLTLFGRDRATVIDDAMEITLAVPLITRIDFLTHRLSVWDFPFVLGAPVEVTEAEFQNGLLNIEQWEQPASRHATPLFIDLDMVDGQRVFLWMEVVAGVSTARLSRMQSLLKARHLIFGLRTGGIGVLNFANLLRLSVHPELFETDVKVSSHAAPIRPASAKTTRTSVAKGSIYEDANI